jgi:hypothetical protein
VKGFSVPSEQWLPFVYAGLWDVPRVFCVRLPTATITLDSDFLENLDDYDPNCVVRLLPPIREDEFLGTRTFGFYSGRVVGRIAVSRDLFDPTLRATIRRAPLDAIGLNELIDAQEES